MNIFSVVLGNMTALICFTILAIYFKNPWLVLIAAFFYRNYVFTETKNEKKGETNER